MSELPGPVRAFLDQAPDGLLVTAETTDVEPGTYPRVLVAVADRGQLRAVARSGVVPRETRAATIAVWLDTATTALTFLAPPTPRGPALTAIRSRAEGDAWLCVLRFDRPISVGRVLDGLAQQSVRPDHVVTTDPVDVRVLNPIGFDPEPTAHVVPLAALDLRRGVTEELVRVLRPVAGVTVIGDEPDAAGVVTALAAAGVPLTASVAPAGLDPDLAAALTSPVDLDDHLAREEHSIGLRRAALRTTSAVRRQPPVSVLLATRRPEMLEHALTQVRRQRGVSELELVLAPHGFEPDPATVRDLVGPEVTLQVVPQAESVVFGDVLNAAAAAARAPVVLKMDDDDWYAPDFVADLLLARTYSAADLVGTADEFYYLAERDLTVQRRHPGEFYTQWVAGGTLMLDRALLLEVGGFAPVPRHVDRLLLDTLLRGGAVVYRTHGLGYVLRRNAVGHTYDADLQRILDPDQVRATWDGFRPSRLHADPSEDLR
jgi:hypothetical protein